MELRFETNEYIEDLYFFTIREHIDAESQNLIAAFYLKLKKYSEARKYFLRALLLDKDRFPCVSGFYQSVSKLPSMQVDSVQTDVICHLRNGATTLSIALHTPDILENITPNDFADCQHFSYEDPHIANLLFRKKGDTLLLFNETYTLESIEPINDAYARLFFSSLIDNPNTIKIESSSAEELISNLTPILQSSSEDLKKVVQTYNEQDMRPPLTILSTLTGRSMLATWEFLLFGNNARIRNNVISHPNITDHSVFILSYDSIVSLAHLNLDPGALSKLSLLCAPQVKNRIMDEVDSLLSDISSEDHAGSLLYVDGEIKISQNTPDSRRERYSFLTKLKGLANVINSEHTSCDYNPDCSEFKEHLAPIFAQKKMYCESGSLGLAQKTENSILVTDDQFLFSVATTDGIPNMGLCSFLTYALNDWSQLLWLSKQLHRMNYLNYLPFELYQKMVDLLIEDEPQIMQGSNEIQNWLISDSDSEPTSYHEDVIIALFNEVYSSNLDYLNPNDILGRLAICAAEKRKPGIIQKVISEFTKKLHTMINSPTLTVVPDKELP